MRKTLEGIELNRLITSLGYEQPRVISNWIGNILRGREGWRKYIVSQSEGEKPIFRVKDEAETLIDNLCVIRPFRSVFLKGAYSEAN